MYKLRSITGNLEIGDRIAIQKHYDTAEATITRTLREFDLRTPIVCSRGRLERIIYATYDIEIYDLTHISTLLYATHEPIIKGQSTMYKTYYIAVKYNTTDEKKQICEDLMNHFHYEQNLLEIFGLVEPTPAISTAGDIWDALSEPVPVDVTATETTPQAPVFSFDIETSTELDTQNIGSVTIKDYKNFVENIGYLKRNISCIWLRQNVTLSDLVFQKCTFELNNINLMGRYFVVDGYPFIIFMNGNEYSLRENKDIVILKLKNRYLGEHYTNAQTEEIKVKFINKYNIKFLTSDAMINATGHPFFRNSLLFYNKVGTDANYFETNIGVGASNYFTFNSMFTNSTISRFSYKWYEDYSNHSRADFIGSFDYSNMVGDEATYILHKKYRNQEEQTGKKYMIVKSNANNKYCYLEFKDNILVCFLTFTEFPSLFLIYNNLFIKNNGNIIEMIELLRVDCDVLMNTLAMVGIFSHFDKKY